MITATAPKDQLLSGLRNTLKTVGFRKRGSVFHRAATDVVHIIGLQSSGVSMSPVPLITLNLAVWCKRLAQPGTEPEVLTSHWRCRLGDVMPEGAEAWWPLVGRNAVAIAQTEMMAALKRYALPVLDRLPDTASLVALWESGSSPGLTREQALRYSDLERASAPLLASGNRAGVRR